MFEYLFFFKNPYLYEFTKASIQICIIKFSQFEMSYMDWINSPNYVSLFHSDSRLSFGTCFGNGVFTGLAPEKAQESTGLCLLAFLCVCHFFEYILRLACWRERYGNVKVKLPQLSTQCQHRSTNSQICENPGQDEDLANHPR